MAQIAFLGTGLLGGADLGFEQPIVVDGIRQHGDPLLRDRLCRWNRDVADHRQRLHGQPGVGVAGSIVSRRSRLWRAPQFELSNLNDCT